MTRPLLRFAALGCVALFFAACDRSEPPAESSTAAIPIPFGTRISFSQAGDSARYKVSGWSKAEEKFTWSEGTSAQLKIPITPTEDPIILKMSVAALINPPALPFQPVEVYVNDQKIADWQVGNTAEFTAPLPAAVTKLGGVLNFTFKTPKATSPKALGQSADERVLGICCLDLELAKR
ncbi:MAG TPA: hypothetical protein VM940_07745 [Chthoniobacterales bacterium]|jgi:hypothetical protein|nr:hypothetical protein [Chthoniobacterales bacterium]